MNYKMNLLLVRSSMN